MPTKGAYLTVDVDWQTGWCPVCKTQIVNAQLLIRERAEHLFKCPYCGMELEAVRPYWPEELDNIRAHLLNDNGAKA